MAAAYQLFEKLPNELRPIRCFAKAAPPLAALWPSTRYPHEPLPTEEQVEQSVAWARLARAILSAAID
jgi:hypothetical protein